MRAYMEKLNIDPNKGKASSPDEGDGNSRPEGKKEKPPEAQPMETPLIRAGHSGWH